MTSKHLCPAALEIQNTLLFPASGLIVCDARLNELYPDFFANDQAPTYLIDAGEDAKNLDTVQSLYQFFLRNSLGRSDMVHVFGGGTICDLAAYAVSTYKRGCRLQLYPSTLLAMVDAAIGGKTGVNFQNLKNHIGSFYPAERIVIHRAFLQTLPGDEVRQGKAEMLKAHMLFEELPLPDFGGNELPDEEEILAHALYKMSLCQEDPFDRGQRMLLNFGHSFGHALESHSAYRIKHGDAIAIGMNMACDISLQMGLIDQQQYDARKETLALYPYPGEVLDYMQSIGFEELYPYLSQDKKNGTNLRLILPVGAEIKAVDLNEV